MADTTLRASAPASAPTEGTTLPPQAAAPFCGDASDFFPEGTTHGEAVEQIAELQKLVDELHAAADAAAPATTKREG